MAEPVNQTGPSPQQPLHQIDADDNVKQLKQCSSLYLSPQECLVNSNRNWKSFQKEVQALKVLYAKNSLTQKLPYHDQLTARMNS